MECRIPYSLGQAVIIPLSHEADGDKSYGAEDHEQVKSQLLVCEEALQTSSRNTEVEIKVYAAQKHENSYDPFDICAVVMAYAAVVYRKSSRSHRTEGMNQGIIQCHASEH